jgi:hypothetical protein
MSELAAKTSKARRDPFNLSSNETEEMSTSMGGDFPHPSAVPGNTFKKGSYYRSNVYLIHAELYYNYLIEKGFANKLEANGIINVDTLVAQFGAW